MDSFSFVISIIVASLLSLFFLCTIIQFLMIAFGELLRKSKMKSYKNPTKKNEINSTKSNCKRRVALNFYFGIYRNVVKQIGFIPSNTFRLFLYKNILQMNIGHKVVIHRNCEIRSGLNITIGEGTIIGDNTILDGNGGIVIGNNVNVSSNSSLYSSQHMVQSSLFEGEYKEIKVGDRCWISSNTVVLPGVIIGEGAVLASGAVATKNLDSFTVYGGVPAKEIKKRNPNLTYCFDGKGTWFN